jgi:outer membrane protein assembly factor BamB
LVIAFDRKTGAQVWQGGTRWEPKEETHEDNPYAAASPVTDGERVVAAFGSAGVFAFDFDGRPLWTRELGPQRHEWGYASSPVILGESVFVYHGPGPGSKLVALDLRTGATAWSVDLPEPVPTERADGFRGRGPGVIGSFSTPLLVKAAGRTELVMSLPESLRAYAPESGRELWRAGGLNPLIYTSPVPSGDVVVAMGGFFGSAIGIKVGGNGDVTASHRAWREERSKKNRLGTGVVKDGHLYAANMEGFFECVELQTGRQLWEERLNGPGAADGSWSSPVLVDDRIYSLNKSGDCFVIRAAPKFEVLATNTVSEPLNSSPALSDGDIFIRTWKGLWCLGDKGALAGR